MASLPPADVGAVAAASMSGLPQTEASMAAVAKLHTRIKKAVPQLQKLEARWNAMVREAGRLRAVIDKVRTRLAVVSLFSLLLHHAVGLKREWW